MAKTARLPVKWSHQVLKLRGQFMAAMQKHGVTPEFLVREGILPLLAAKKRRIIYSASGVRETTWVIDGHSVRAGLEISLELLGLRHPIGMEATDTKTADNVITGMAIAELTVELHDEGKTIAAVNKYLFSSDEGVRAIMARREAIIKAGASDVDTSDNLELKAQSDADSGNAGDSPGS